MLRFNVRCNVTVVRDPTVIPWVHFHRKPRITHVSNVSTWVNIATQQLNHNNNATFTELRFLFALDIGSMEAFFDCELLCCIMLSCSTWLRQPWLDMDRSLFTPPFADEIAWLWCPIVCIDRRASSRYPVLQTCRRSSNRCTCYGRTTVCGNMSVNTERTMCSKPHKLDTPWASIKYMYSDCHLLTFTVNSHNQHHIHVSLHSSYAPPQSLAGFCPVHPIRLGIISYSMYAMCQNTHPDATTSRRPTGE